MHPMIGRSLLQGAGRHDGPKSFAEIAASLAASALGHVTIHHDKTMSLLHRVIRGFDVGMGNEFKIAFTMKAEARGQIVDEAVDVAVGVAVGLKNRLQRGIVDSGFGFPEGHLIVLGAQLVAPMQDLEESFELGQKGFAIALNLWIGVIAQEFNFPDQMSQAELDLGVALAGKLLRFSAIACPPAG